jgi:hypothetical protein
LLPTSPHVSVLDMADRNPSFFGPVLPQEPGAPPAFSDGELVMIRARRLEVEILRAQACAWPGRHRFETMYPARRVTPTPKAPGASATS